MTRFPAIAISSILPVLMIRAAVAQTPSAPPPPANVSRPAPPPIAATTASRIAPALQAVRGDDGMYYLPGAPMMVSASHAYVEAINSLGRYALIWHRDALPPPNLNGDPLPPTLTMSLLLWDAVSGRATTLWSAVSQNGSLDADLYMRDWISGTTTCVAVIRVTDRSAPTEAERQPQFTLFTAEVTRQGHLIPVLSSPDQIRLSVSPNRALAAVSLHEPLPVQKSSANAVDNTGEAQYHTNLRFFDARGQVGSPLPFEGYALSPVWGKDGKTAYVFAAERVTAPDGSITEARHWYSLDPATGSRTLLAAKPDRALIDMSLPGSADTPPLRIETLPMTPPQPNPWKEKPLSSLWLRPTSGKAGLPATAATPTALESYPRLMLAPDCDGVPTILPDRSAVLYSYKGAVYSIPLVRMSPERYAAASRAARVQQTMSNAKQVGLALMMYLQDNDERFPASGGDIPGLLKDYTRSGDIFDNPASGLPAFTYLLNGEQQAQMNDVAHTAIGYLGGPDGGRAVLFADGHVQWQDTPTSP